MEEALKIMSNNLLTVSEDAPLVEAQGMMKLNNIRHLPVVNEECRVVGLLSDRDLQRAMRSQVVGEGEALWESCEFDPEHIASDYMSWPVKTVDVHSSLKTVTKMMLKEKISSYLVTDQSVIVGIITTDDLLRYLIKDLDEEHLTWRDTLADLFSVDRARAGAYAQTLADVGF